MVIFVLGNKPRVFVFGIRVSIVGRKSGDSE